MFRVVIVAAVSTTAQATDDKASIPQQVEACREICEARDWRIVATIEIPGHSRNYNWLHEIIRDCPGYAEMVRVVESARVDLIVVRDYDRLWRTDALRAQIAALCREHHVQIFSLNQPVEPEDVAHLEDASDSHLIVEALSGIIGQQENKARARRHRLGMVGRVRRGLHNPGPTTPYGYRRDDEGELAIDEAEAPWVRHIFQRYLSGVGRNRIAVELTDMGIPTPGSRRPALHTSPNARWYGGTIKRILANPVYIGTAFWGGYTNPNGKHAALISQADFERCRRCLIERRRFRDGPAYADHVLRGLVRCGFCGMSMVYYRAGGRSHLRCREYVATFGRRCQHNGHSATRLHQYVMEAVQTVLYDPDAFTEARQEQVESHEVRGQLEAIERELSQAQTRFQRWNLLYEEGKINADELMLHRQRIYGRTGRLSARRDELTTIMGDEAAMRQRIVSLSNLVALLPDLSPTELREQVYTPLIREVVLKRPDEPRIRWW